MIRLDSLLQQAFANLGDCSLDRGGVVEQWQIEVNRIEVYRVADIDLRRAADLVVVTILFVAKCEAFAGSSV